VTATELRRRSTRQASAKPRPSGASPGRSALRGRADPGPSETAFADRPTGRKGRIRALRICSVPSRCDSRDGGAETKPCRRRIPDRRVRREAQQRPRGGACETYGGGPSATHCRKSRRTRGAGLRASHRARPATEADRQPPSRDVIDASRKTLQIMRWLLGG
jgi:hypothetical protein